MVWASNRVRVAGQIGDVMSRYASGRWGCRGCSAELAASNRAMKRSSIAVRAFTSGHSQRGSTGRKGARSYFRFMAPRRRNGGRWP